MAPGTAKVQIFFKLFEDTISKVHWQFPQLQALTISSVAGLNAALNAIPDIRAPNLTELHVLDIANHKIPSRVFALAISCAHLQSLVLRSAYANEDNEPQGSLSSSLRSSGARWPRLTTLIVDVRFLSAPLLLDALLDCVTSPLTSLSIRLAAAETVRVFREHPNLRELQLAAGHLVPSAAEEAKLAVAADRVVMDQLTALELGAADDTTFASVLFPNVASLKVNDAAFRVASLDVVFRACPALRTLRVIHPAPVSTWRLPENGQHDCAVTEIVLESMYDMPSAWKAYDTSRESSAALDRAVAFFSAFPKLQTVKISFGYEEATRWAEKLQQKARTLGHHVLAKALDSAVQR